MPARKQSARIDAYLGAHTATVEPEELARLRGNQATRDGLAFARCQKLPASKEGLKWRYVPSGDVRRICNQEGASMETVVAMLREYMIQI